MVTLPVDGVALNEITRQARDVHFARTLLTWIASILFGIGWLAYKILAVLWLACAWTFVAVRAGWRSAKANSGPDRSG